MIILVSAHRSNDLPDLQICYVLVCFQAFLLLNVFVARLELLLFEQLQQLALYQLLSIVFERLSIFREDLQHEHVHHKPGYKASDRHALVHDGKTQLGIGKTRRLIFGLKNVSRSNYESKKVYHDAGDK